MRNVKWIAVATVAALAVGSGSATAASLVTSAKIKDGTIQSKDLSAALRAQIEAKPTNGKNGAAGAAGATGATGLTGATGAKGADGPPGVSGSTWTTTVLPDTTIALGAPEQTIATLGGIAIKLGCIDNTANATNHATWSTAAPFSISGTQLTDPFTESYETYESSASSHEIWAFDWTGIPTRVRTTSGASLEVRGHFKVSRTSCSLTDAVAYRWQD